MTPHSASSVRPPAVAGLFYPAEAGLLTRTVSDLLAGVDVARSQVPKALIAPHAGYVYSGPIAAHAYARLAAARGTVKRVVLLGPTHRVAVRGLAIPRARAFATPLGTIELDAAAIESIRELPQIVVSDEAHAMEHSLEVHLPFLQNVLGDFKLVPLAVGYAEPADVAAVIEALWGGPETLIVVSSDLSHYLRYEQAQAVDRATVERILRLDADIQPHEACGAGAINGALTVARHHGLTARLLDLRNSGDTGGERHRVVGYAALAFEERAHQ